MIAASIVERQKEYELIGFINDVEPVGKNIGKFKQHRIVGTTRDIPTYLLNDHNTYILNCFVGMTNEKKKYDSFKALGIPRERFATILDPSAVIPYSYCQIGAGVLVAPLVQVSPDVTISDHCLLLGNSFIGHDTFLDECVSLATNSVIGANVRIGKAVHVGSNATIRERIRIGNYCLIGMGSVVIKDVPDHCTVVGNPARILRVDLMVNKKENLQNE